MSCINYSYYNTTFCLFVYPAPLPSTFLYNSHLGKQVNAKHLVFRYIQFSIIIQFFLHIWSSLSLTTYLEDTKMDGGVLVVTKGTGSPSQQLFFIPVLMDFSWSWLRNALAAALLHTSLFSEQSSLDGFSLHFLPQPLSKG